MIGRGALRAFKSEWPFGSRGSLGIRKIIFDLGGEVI